RSLQAPRSGRESPRRGSRRRAARPRSRGTSRGAARRSTGGLSDEPLDDDGVAPRAVEPRVPSIRPDLAKPDLREKLAARLVLRKDAGDELPDAATLALAHERFHRGTTRAGAARVARDVPGKLGDP